MRRKKSDNDDKIDETVDSRKHGKDIKILELKCENLEKALLLNDNLMIAEQTRSHEIEVSLGSKLAHLENHLGCINDHLVNLLQQLQIDFTTVDEIETVAKGDDDITRATNLIQTLQLVSSKIHEREIMWHSKIEDERQKTREDSFDVVRKCEKLEESLLESEKRTQKLQYHNTEIRFKLQSDIAVTRKDLSDNRLEIANHKSDNLKFREMINNKNGVIRLQQSQLEKVSKFEETVFSDVTKLSLKFRSERNSDLKKLSQMPRLDARIRELEGENVSYRNQVASLRQTITSLRLNANIVNANRELNKFHKEHQNAEKWKKESLKLEEVIRDNNRKHFSDYVDKDDDDDISKSSSNSPMSPTPSVIGNDMSPADRKLNRRRAASASAYFKRGMQANRMRFENNLMKTNKIHSEHDSSKKLLTSGDVSASNEEEVFNSSRNLVVSNRHADDKKAKNQRLEASRMSIAGRQKEIMKELSYLNPQLTDWIQMSSSSETIHLFDDEDRAILHRLTNGIEKKK